MTECVLATFSCGDMLLGVPVESVYEVLRDQRLEPVPRAPLGVVGLISVRGRILAVTDVRTRLGVPPAEDTDPAYYVVQGQDGLDVLRVDRAAEVLAVNSQQAIEVPDTTPAAIARQLSGAYHVDDLLVLVVDLNRLLDAVQDWGAMPHAGSGH